MDWTAIGTLALAGATVAAIIVAQVQARKDRQRGDAERLDEIKRDDRLRREAAEEREQHEAADRRAREDYEARQVVVIVTDDTGTGGPRAASIDRTLMVSTPLAYPVKQVAGAWVMTGNGNFSVVDDFRADEPVVTGDRASYIRTTRISSGSRDAQPVIRFVDWHGNLYYQYRHYTERFPQNTDFHDAAVKIDEWIRTGPNPD